MNFLIRWSPIALSAVVIYLLAYLHEYDFGFGMKVDYLFSEVVHFAIFIIFGYLTCKSLCRSGQIKRPHIIYAFAIIFFTAVIGVLNEVRIDPEHEGHFRDMIMHWLGGVLGMVFWRLHRTYHEEEMKLSQ